METFQKLKIKSIKNLPKETVYDITVEGVENYILENGVITHNSGLKYSASSIVFLSKAKDRDGKDVVGNIIRVKMEKSRLSKEHSNVQLKLSYETGLDKYYGLLDLAQKYEIIKKITAQSYELPDGTKVKGTDINKNPEKYYTQEILAAIDEAAKKEYKYGNVGDDRSGEDDGDSDD